MLGKFSNSYTTAALCKKVQRPHGTHSKGIHVINIHVRHDKYVAVQLKRAEAPVTPMEQVIKNCINKYRAQWDLFNIKYGS